MKVLEEKLIREPLYEKLKKRLLNYIESENIRMLPNEKELMDRYGVSRNTLRRAILELTKEKVLQPVQGLGTLVYPVPEVVTNSRILVVFDPDMRPYQQELFNQLLLQLSNSQLNATVLMLDKKNINVQHFEQVLKTCDAVLIDHLCSFSPTIVEIVRRTGKKFVCLRWQPELEMNYVAEDINTGFYQLVKHLIDLGHTKIAFMGNSKDPRRWPGIERAFQEHGMEIDPKLIFHCEHGFRHDGYQQADALLKSKREFTAVIGNSDEAALGIMERLLVAGIRIPEDVSVTGFDNLKDSKFYPVPLTTCCGNVLQMINEAIAYLFSARNSEITLNKIVEPRLIIRKSTGPVRAKK